jgi:uncharacterized protein YbaR (Trm112 family)/2-polyprenyl-3-methyl-5-hydroxy-6-metoxy-1,4-benzoquinol methylase
MLEQRFLDMLCCPACRGELRTAGDREELRCPACAFDFPIVDGIPVLFPCNVKQEFDRLFGRHWDSEEKASYYDENIEGVGDPDPFAKYQHESELLGIEQCYEASKLGSLLDAGCGNGRFLATLPAATVKVGVDASLNLLRATRRRGRGDLLVCCELEHLPFKDGIFDTVISCRVLQHIVDQESAVSEMCRATRVSGDVILEVYNTWNPKTLYKAIRMSRLAPVLNAPFQWIHPKWSPFAPWGMAYDRYNSWAELSRWLRGCGMRVVDARGVGFGFNKYLVGPFLIHALVRRISPALLRAYYDLCLRLEPIVGRLVPLKYVMEKLVVKATK